MSKKFLFLRKIHGKLHEFKLSYCNKNNFIKTILKNTSNVAFVIGAPDHDNLGDSAIVLAEFRFLKKCGYNTKEIREITVDEYYLYRRTIKAKIRRDSVLFGVGGGNMGNQWLKDENLRYDIISDFPYNLFIIFPQTIHFIDGDDGAIKRSIDIYNTHKNLIIVAREKKSFQILKELYPNVNVLLTPDIVLSTTRLDYGLRDLARENILFCMRNDVEKSISNVDINELKTEINKHGFLPIETSTSNFEMTKFNRRDCVNEKLQEFRNAKLIITDRLHGMIFAAIAETPCIVFSNYNHKVKGTYEWISYLPYIKYVETVEDAISLIDEMLELNECKFDNVPLLPFFDNLREIIEKQKNSNKQ